MTQAKETEFKKVSGQIFDPSREVKKTNNVFNNINIADNIATLDDIPVNQLVQKSRNFAANNRSDKDIKASLKNLG